MVGDLGIHVVPESTTMAEQVQGNNLGDVVLGNFELVAVLGTGTYAVAYLAKQEGSERLAVVKVAHPHLMTQKLGDMVRGRFAAEFRAMTRIQHPNLVTIFTAGETPNELPALAMEYVEGHSLQEIFLERAPLTQEELVPIFMQLASALNATHRAGVVHRDVTPSNIILSRKLGGEPCIKLLDFGVARLDDISSNQSFGPVGTPRYLAPEQFFGEAVRASDMFSFGSLLWWAVTGEEYLKDIDSIRSFYRHISETKGPPDPRSARPTLNPVLATLVQDLLHPEADRRPSAAEFIRRWLGLYEESVGATSSETMALMEETPPPFLVDVPAEPKPSRSSRGADGPLELAKVMLIDPLKERRDQLDVLFRRQGCFCELVETTREAKVLLRRGSYDIILFAPQQIRRAIDEVFEGLYESLGVPRRFSSALALLVEDQPLEHQSSSWGMVIDLSEGEAVLIAAMKLLSAKQRRAFSTTFDARPETIPGVASIGMLNASAASASSEALARLTDDVFDSAPPVLSAGVPDAAPSSPGPSPSASQELKRIISRPVPRDEVEGGSRRQAPRGVLGARRPSKAGDARGASHQAPSVNVSASGVRRAPSGDVSASGVRRAPSGDVSASGVRRALSGDVSASGIRRTPTGKTSRVHQSPGASHPSGILRPQAPRVTRAKTPDVVSQQMPRLVRPQTSNNVGTSAIGRSQSGVLSNPRRSTGVQHAAPSTTEGAGSHTSRSTFDSRPGESAIGQVSYKDFIARMSGWLIGLSDAIGERDHERRERICGQIVRGAILAGARRLARSAQALGHLTSNTTSVELDGAFDALEEAFVMFLETQVS